MTEEIRSVSYSQAILGEQAIKSFIFKENKLHGVSYCIQDESLKDLLSKFKKEQKVFEINTLYIEPVELIYSQAYKIIKNEKGPAFIDGTNHTRFLLEQIIGEIELVKKANETEKKGYKTTTQKTKKKDGTLDDITTS